MMLTFEEKYKAIVDKDPSFEGVFITAVKSTGIFYRPVCTARKPKPENVVFYDSVKEAVLNGFRPCKVCKPLEHVAVIPPDIKTLLEELHAMPFNKIKDYHLREKGFEPSHLRRWFKKHFNMTFHSYQRMLRINGAYKKIMVGDTITNAAFESGYESLSGFNNGYRTIFGKAPSKSKQQTVINIVRFTTPLGPMFGCATTNGVCLLEFTDRKALETEFKQLCKLLNAVILPGPNPHLDQLQKEMEEYFEGKRTQFEVALHTPGTSFQQKVWNILREVPYGETRSYKQQAIALQKLKAIRAVASANGDNRISIIIPCHRIIGEDGSLTGYGGGLPRKKWLIDCEVKNAMKLLEI